MNGSGAGGGVLILGCVVLALYFAPTIIAAARHHRQALAIGAVNFFFGWTAIGWIISLVWALTSPSSGSPTIVVNASATSAATPVTPARTSQPWSWEPPPPPQPEPVALPPPRVQPCGPIDEDTRFWDGMDKADPDLLEEYLIRFPAGRFATLARRKLDRLGAEPARTPAPARTHLAPSLGVATPVTECRHCGAAAETASRFCTTCGAATAVS